MDLSRKPKKYNLVSDWLATDGALFGAEHEVLFSLIRGLYNSVAPDYEPCPFRINKPRRLPVGVTGVDVLIPCFQHAENIEDTVRSVLAQTVQPRSIHILLMDSASWLVRDDLEALSNKISCYVSDRMWPAEARNKLSQYGSGSHIIFLDADDPMEDPTIIEKFLEYKHYDIVMPRWEEFGEPVKRICFYNLLYNSQTTSLLRRDFFKACRFNERFVNGAEDTELFVRAYLEGASVAYSDAPFKRSKFRTASYWTLTRYGSYDLLYEHRHVFLPLLERFYASELDAMTLSRLMFLIRLLKAKVDASNFNDVARSTGVHALWLARSLAPRHKARNEFPFARLVSAGARLVSLNKLNNEKLSAQFIHTTPASPSGSPSISVIIPCYMQSTLVADAIASVLAQTEEKLVAEIIVLLMDAESRKLKDALEDIDARVRCFTESRMWLPEARNFMIKKSTGTHIIPLDADDGLVETYIEELLPFIGSRDVVFTDILRDDGTSSADVFCDTTIRNLFDFPVAHPTAIISRSFIDNKLNGIAYDPLFNTGFEDHDFWFRCAQVGSLEYVRKPLIRYRGSKTPRGSREASYLTMAGCNFNSFEMFIKHRAVCTKYATQSVLSSDTRIAEAATEFLEQLKRIDISSTGELL